MTQKRTTGKQSSGRRKTIGSDRLKIDTTPLTSDQPVGIFSSLEGKEKQETPAPTTTLSLDKISRNPAQPRRYFDPDKQRQLVESVRRDGILQPLLVRPKGEGYELVAGERRYLAAQEVGLTEVPVTVRELTDEQARQYALTENLQREDLSPVEETEGILALLEIRLGVAREQVISLLNRMANEKRGVTDNAVRSEEKQAVDEVFASVGRLTPESFRTHRLPLLNLPEDILEALRKGQIEYTKAKALAQVKDDLARAELLEEAIEPGLSLSGIRERVKALKEPASAKEAPGAEDLRKRGSKLSGLFKKSSALDDPQTRQKLEKLLRQMEKLLR